MNGASLYCIDKECIYLYRKSVLFYTDTLCTICFKVEDSRPKWRHRVEASGPVCVRICARRRSFDPKSGISPRSLPEM